MAARWLDNPLNPAANPFINGGLITGYTGTFISMAGGVQSVSAYTLPSAVDAQNTVFTVINAGTIASPALGVVLGVGGTITNQTNGLIAGDPGAALVGVSGAITNQSGGVISAAMTAKYGSADLEGSGTVFNAGTIIGNYGVVARTGSSVTNTATGTVTAGADGIFLGQNGYVPAVFNSKSKGSVFNNGFVTAQGGNGLANGIVLNVDAGYVFNSGTVIGSIASQNVGLGVALNYGGNLVNTGTIRGGFAGMSANGNQNGANVGTATVTNSGSVFGSAYGIRLFGVGSVTNQTGGGITGGKIALLAFQSVTISNQTGGRITGGVSGKYGVDLEGAGTVINAGGIRGKTAIVARLNGRVTNADGGYIVGDAAGILVSQSASSPMVFGGLSNGSVINSGFIAAAGNVATIASGIAMNVNNAYVMNSGTIIGTIQGGGGFGFGVNFSYGGTLNNSGTVTGLFIGFISGSAISKGAGTLFNTGTVSGYTGVVLGGGGAVINPRSGTIKSNSTMPRSSGVYLRGSALVNNGGSIVGGAAGVYAKSFAATVYNLGVISGSSTGINLKAGGFLSNAPSGYISGTMVGVSMTSGPSTVISYGTIRGSVAAVQFGSGNSNTLSVYPGAVFNGAVDGGNNPGAKIASTLKLLRSGGGSVGTLQGLGTNYINFAQTTVAANASWKLTGASTVVANATLTNLGTLAVVNSSAVWPGKVINNGVINIDPSTLTFADLEGTGEVVIDSGSTVVTLGTVTTGQTLAFSGGDGVLDLTPSGFAGTIDGFGAGDTISLTGVTDATAAGIVNGNTLQIQRADNPAVDLTLDPSLSYNGISFATDTNGDLSTTGGRTLNWIGGDGAAFSVAANWDDVSSNLNPAQSAPNQTDTVVFDSTAAFSATATVAAVEVGAAGTGALELSGGATLVTGSLDAGVGAADVGEIGLTGAGTDLTVTGTATVAGDGTGVLSVLSGASFAAANLTIGDTADGSGAVIVSGAGSVINLTGALDVGTALGAGDITLGPGAAVHAVVVNLQGQVVLEGGLLDPTVNLINQGQTAGGYGTIAAGDIIDEGVIQAASQKTLIVQGTVLGGGTLTINGAAQPSGPAGVLQINAGGTLEVTGAVLNAATTTFTDPLTPAGTYTVTNSVVDVTFADGTGVLVLDDIAGFGGTVTTFHTGDLFILPAGTLSNLGVSNANTLTFSDSGPGGGTDQIVFGSAVSAGWFQIVNHDTVQAVACFAEGTRIETVSGLVAVEDLRTGDTVVTADGATEPIVWIGRRGVHCRRHSRPETVWPVRVRAGAFGETVPVRDLYLSPDHAVLVNGVLIPVKLLINDRGITRTRRDRVTYFHVELPRHAAILAEGLPVESYLDTGDRRRFTGPRARLFPNFAAVALAWETRGAARLVMTGPELSTARRHVNALAADPLAAA